MRLRRQRAATLEHMTPDEVMRWVAGHEKAWREGDAAAVQRLFTDDARYRPSPYDDANVGHDAIKAFWFDDEGEAFTMSASPVAVEGDTAVVQGYWSGMATRSARSISISGSSGSPTTAASTTSRSGPTGPASRSPPDRLVRV